MEWANAEIENARELDELITSGNAHDRIQLLKTIHAIDSKYIFALPEFSDMRKYEVKNALNSLSWYRCDESANDSVLCIALRQRTPSTLDIKRHAGRCILTVDKGYTIAGDLWSVRFLTWVLYNSIDDIKQHVHDARVKYEAADVVTLCCPSNWSKEDDCTMRDMYFNQSLISVALVIACQSRNDNLFDLLLDFASLDSTVELHRTYAKLHYNTNSIKATMKALLLHEAITLANKHCCAKIIARDYAILQTPVIRRNISYLAMLIDEDMLSCVLELDEDNADQLLQIISANLSMSSKELRIVEPLTEMQKEKLTTWRDAVFNSSRHEVYRPYTYIKSGILNFITTGVAMMSAVAFSGVGDVSIKDAIAEAGFPTGVITASLFVLVIVSVSCVATDYIHGRVSRTTAVNLIFSSVMASMPVSPLGAKGPESLQKTSPMVAVALTTGTIFSCVLILFGIATIHYLPKFTDVSATFSPICLILTVTAVVSALGALTIPALFHYTHKALDTDAKLRK